MVQRTPTTQVRFVERPPAWLRWGGGAFLAVIAVTLAAGASAESIWPLYPAAAAFLVAAGWCVSW